MQKVLTVVYNLEKGGTQRAAQVFAEAYCALGYDSRLLALYGLGPRYEEIKSKINTWHLLTRENLNEIFSWNPDIVHIHSHGAEEEDINKLLLEKPQKTKVVETNVFSLPSPWHDKIDISFQLSGWAKWLFDLRGGKRMYSEVIPYPVNCQKFNKANDEEIKNFKKEYNIPQEAVVLGRLGQSYPGKWSPMLIRVFDQLALEDLNIYLVIINPPPNIIELSKRSHATDRIIVIPQILGDMNISIAYSSMNVMVHIAEQGESFGMVLAESLLCEVPVVTLSTPWGDNSQCEVVGNAKGGYVVNSFEGLKKALIALISNPDLALKFGQLGRKHVIDNYEHIKVAEMVIRSLAMKRGKNNTSGRLEIINILNNTLDRPTLFTKLFVKLNNNFFRKLTEYTSCYSPFSSLPNKAYLKLKKVFN